MIFGELSEHLINSQRGFPLRSNQPNHRQKCVDNVCTKMEAVCQIDAAYLDYTKAFDPIDNDAL